MNFKRQVAFSSLLMAVLMVVTWIYWPGLEGPYLFDDKPNLESINDYGGVKDLETLGRFTLGAPGFPGRPLSLLTFAINDQAWPLDTFSVKFTNLMIHLLVGISIFLFVRRFLSINRWDELSATYFAFCVMAIYLLHPLNVSTVLYAIQRMAQLSALLTILGLIVFLHILQRAQKVRDLGRVQASDRLVWIAGGALGFIAAIGILFKENAFLLFPLAWLTVTFLPKDLTQHVRHLQLWRLVFFVAPIVLFLLYYFIFNSSGADSAAVYRGYTASERFVTQFNVVLDYFLQILSPNSLGWGLYYDDYPVVRSLFESPKTILSAGFHVCIILVFFYLRKSLPVASFGIFWFYISHSLESSFISLELYFEHRNYLPMVGLLISAADIVRNLLRHIRWKKSIAISLPIVIVIFEALLTSQRVHLWSDEGRLSKVWADENPTSARSQTQYISFAFKNGDLSESLDYSIRATRTIPDDLSLYLTRIYISCVMDLPRNKDLIEKTVEVAKTSVYENASYIRLDHLVEMSMDEECRTISLSDIGRIYASLEDNKKFMASDSFKSTHYYYRAKYYESKRDLNATIEFITKAYSLKQNPLYLAKKASWLASAGLIDDAWMEFERLKNNHRPQFFENDSELPIVRNTRKEIENYERYWSALSQ